MSNTKVFTLDTLKKSKHSITLSVDKFKVIKKNGVSSIGNI